AGEIAMRHFRNDPETWFKEGSSPVSEADIAVDEFLRRELLSARPDYGWLSEETADNRERRKARRTFVVDPIDGNRGLLEGTPTRCVSIAVVDNGISLVGVLDFPAKQEIYEAPLASDALLNGAKITVSA